MGNNKNKIKLLQQCPYVILCEGVDEKFFLIQYIEYLVQHTNLPDQINVIDLGGNEDLRKTLPIIPKLENYQYVESVLIIRDAECDAQRAIESLKNSIHEAFQLQISDSGSFENTEDKKRIGFALLPGLNSTGSYQNGTLEDLCVRIIKNTDLQSKLNEIDTAVTQFMEQIVSIRKKAFRTPHKNKLHTYFASTDKFVGQKIGEAAKSGCFDFEHKELQFLRDAIFMLVGLEQ